MTSSSTTTTPNAPSAPKVHASARRASAAADRWTAPETVAGWRWELTTTFWRVRRHLEALGDPVLIGTRQKRALRAVKCHAALNGRLITRTTGHRSGPTLQEVADHFGYKLRTVERAVEDLRESRDLEVRPLPLPRAARELP